MTTTDNTPDPTPALLSAARLAEIRERVSYTVIAEAHNEAIADRAALLAHLDALTPRAPVDGEALGREARASHMDWSEDTASVWPFLTEKVRGDYCRTAIHVHAIGYAARASEGEAERAESAKLALFVNTALADECAALRAIAADPKAHAAEAVAQEKALHDLEVEGLDAAIARLTAELAEARADTARVEAALNSSIRAYHEQVEEKASLLAAARLDGARVEREATILDALSVARETHPSAQPAVCKAMSDLGERIKAREPARATEGRQGS